MKDNTGNLHVCPNKKYPSTSQPLHFVVAKEGRNHIDSPNSQAAPGSGAEWEVIRREVMKDAAEFAALAFSAAATEWLKEQELYHPDRPKTLKSYVDYITRLKPAFGPLPLSEIHIGHIQAYQRAMRKRYHPRSVNHDVCLLSQLLKRAGAWKEIREHYRPLPVPKWQPPKVLSEQEEDAFFAIASSDPAFSLAYWVASLTNNTSASGKELRLLQRQHVEMDAQPPAFRIPDSKNKYRERKIPLNERGEIQMQRILERAASLGSTKPEHYVFPLRPKRGFYDPTQPASESWLSKQWRKMVRAALEQNAISFAIKPHNLRHQIITKLLEDGQPEEVVRSIAGHVSREMMEHYSHTRIQRKFSALDAINPDKRKKPQAPVRLARKVGA